MLDTLTHTILAGLAISGLTVLCALGKVSAEAAVPIIGSLGGISGVAGVVAAVRKPTLTVVEAPPSGGSATMGAQG